MKFERTWGDTLPFELYDFVGFDRQPVVDLAGWQLWYTLKLEEDGPEPGVVRKSTSAGTITASGSVARLEISDTECRALLPDVTYLYDVQGRDPQGRLSTLDRGTLKLTKDISRSS